MPHNLIPNVTNFKLAVGPKKNPISLNRAKDYLRVSTGHEDGLINALVMAATDHVERITGQLLMPQTWDFFMDYFPFERLSNGGAWWDGVRDGPLTSIQSQKSVIELWKVPLQSIEFLKTFDVTDTESIFPAANYIVDNNSWPTRIVLRQGQTWPSTTLRTANGIQIRFIGGYLNADSIPKPIITALELILGNIYENRGDEEKAIQFPPAATMLLNNYMIRRL